MALSCCLKIRETYIPQRDICISRAEGGTMNVKAKSLLTQTVNLHPSAHLRASTTCCLGIRETYIPQRDICISRAEGGTMNAKAKSLLTQTVNPHPSAHLRASTTCCLKIRFTAFAEAKQRFLRSLFLETYQKLLQMRGYNRADTDTYCRGQGMRGRKLRRLFFRET